MTPRRPPWWVRLRLHLDSLDRYHAGAVLVLMAGVLGDGRAPLGLGRLLRRGLAHVPVRRPGLFPPGLN
jgi:hypothetical protein